MSSENQPPPPERPSLASLGRDIEARRLDPRDIVEGYLDRASKTKDVYVRVTAERAKREAAAAADRAKRGLRRGLLDGAPISWKDLFAVAGVPNEAGSKLCAGTTPADDAPVVARAARAGLPCLGKTHLSELAFSGLGYNPMTATAPNIFDASRVPGGSSSGAAASVTHDAAPAAIGSDTGGSVRIPSAWNGLVGLKTTHGLIPLEGVTPLSPSLDTVGPLTRTVEDAALLYAVLAKRPAPDLTSTNLNGAAFYIAETVMLDDVAPELLEAFETSVERLAQAGARITRGPAPEFSEVLSIAASHGAIVNTEGYAVWREAIEARPNDIYPMIRERFRSGAGYRADQIDFTRLEIQRLQRAYLARTAGFDAILSPTTPNHAPRITDIADDEAVYVRENLAALRNTRLGNLLGLCSLALPTAATPSGLPASLMLTAAPFAEPALLRLGAAAEYALAS
ncbi:MAG: amidase [Rhodobacteraceae bacterium]|nr:amidase [Paracoccaceae bacterium]